MVAEELQAYLNVRHGSAPFLCRPYLKSLRHSPWKLHHLVHDDIRLYRQDPGKVYHEIANPCTCNADNGRQVSTLPVAANPETIPMTRYTPWERKHWPLNIICAADEHDCRAMSDVAYASYILASAKSPYA